MGFMSPSEPRRGPQSRDRNDRKRPGPGVVIAVMMVCLSAIVVVLLVAQPVVTAVIALGLLAATVFLGRRADSAMRHRLRHGTRTWDDLPPQLAACP